MLKFYKCAKCGAVVAKIVEKPCPIMCCGEAMVELTANTEEAAFEKHIPDVTMDGDVIVAKVGSVEHPMMPEHFIQFITLETEGGMQIKYLKPEEKPEAKFVAADGKAIAVYEFCNLHGLWKKEL